ncbi:MAG: hypothetical protein AVDCRST_MAG73-819, partial [uncultured Thermomicrobiales bacterium]
GHGGADGRCRQVVERVPGVATAASATGHGDVDRRRGDAPGGGGRARPGVGV